MPLYCALVRLPDDVPPYCVHQFLYGYFPQCPPSANRPFVYRELADGILMLSGVSPACPHVEISPGIEAGRSYAFDALFNPVIKRNGTVMGVVKGNAARQAWLRDRIQGATIGFVQVYDQKPRRFRRGGGLVITFEPVQYKGTLCVTDAQVFEGWLIHPPGKSKAFGCGLVVLPDLMRDVLEASSS